MLPAETVMNRGKLSAPKASASIAADQDEGRPRQWSPALVRASQMLRGRLGATISARAIDCAVIAP